MVKLTSSAAAKRQTGDGDHTFEQKWEECIVFLYTNSKDRLVFDL
jgi:hypothetical protein